ncbi:MAG TPA: ABC transporter ATP-binding protein [Methylomirabilota bacterium]
MTVPVLEVAGLTKRFAGVTALDEIDLTVRAGELVGVIGPNGSGKTTLFNCIAGAVRPDRGRIALDGREITGRPPHVAARRGVGRTFQAARVFPRLTAREHLLAALQEFQADGFAARLFRLPAAARAEADADRRARALLDWVGLAETADRPATLLSYGQRKLLAFAMALAPAPRVLMLDEPMAGVNPVLVARLAGHIRELRAEGRTVVLIEHNLTVVMTLCERVVVLDHGQKVAEGPPAVVREMPAVIEAYFGS